jgi:predicted secreted protein
VVVYLDNYPLGGQQGATLVRQAQVIDITNKINGDWSESLTGTKSWSITCAGLYVVNDKSFLLLEDAFMNNKQVEVSINVGSQQLKGKALITDFPLNAVFNKEFKYNLRLLGTGALA